MGLKITPYTWGKGAPWGEHLGFTVDDQGPDEWNPATDQTDSDRMAIKLGMVTYADEMHVWCRWFSKDGNLVQSKAPVPHDNTLEGKCAAVREARMAVAVEIGRQL
jgi:hypothetical protein